MAFRVYCAHCQARLQPPFWSQFGQAFCNPEHAEKWKQQIALDAIFPSEPAAPAGDQERFEAEAEVAGAYAGSARLTKTEADGKARELYLYNTSNGWYVRGEECVNKRTDILFRRVDPRMVEIDREDLSAVVATIERRMMSDDACDRPFDEDLAEALALLRTVKGE